MGKNKHTKSKVRQMTNICDFYHRKKNNSYIKYGHRKHTKKTMAQQKNEQQKYFKEKELQNSLQTSI